MSLEDCLPLCSDRHTYTRHPMIHTNGCLHTFKALLACMTFYRCLNTFDSTGLLKCILYTSYISIGPAIGGFGLHFTVLIDMVCCELPNLWIQSRKDIKRFLSFNHLACRCVGSLGTRVQSTGLNVKSYSRSP